MAYDSKCFDLAELFLSDEPAICTEKNKRDLAQHIQSSIEEWMAYVSAQQSADELNDQTCSSHPCPSNLSR